MKTRPQQRGFALLLVFVLAASIAIFLYMQLPRVAFEAQRDKEQMLIDRGEQYQRAIGLFVKKNGGKYPAKIEDLENYNNVRFLRHRYKDPMTGKDDWRFIHVGPGGVLIDSVNTKKKEQAKPGDDQSTANQFITEMPRVGQLPTAPGANTVATRRRASDMPGAPGQMAEPAAAQRLADPNNPVAANPPMPPPGMDFQPAYPTAPGTGPAAAYAPNPPFPGQPPVPGAVGYYNPAGGAAMPPTGLQAYGQGYSGPVNDPNAAAGQQPPYAGQSPNQPAAMPYGIPGVPQQPGAAPSTNAALQQIRNMLANPRPVSVAGYPQQSTQPAAPQAASSFGSGSTGSFGTPMSQSASPSAFGGGDVMGSQIAGVASKADGDAIRVYNDHSKYKEWEFIYDPAKDKSLGLAQSINGGGMPNPNSTPNSPPGSAGSFGGSSSFGSGGSSGSFGSGGSSSSFGSGSSQGSSFNQMGPR